jgi:hypothetical protein
MEVETEVYRIPANLGIKKIDIDGASLELGEANMVQVEKIPSKNALNVYRKRSNEGGEIMNGLGMVQLDMSSYLELMSFFKRYGFEKL